MPANRNKKFEKAKDFKSAIKRLLKELNPFKALVILSLTLSVAASILSIATPNILSKLTDKISNGIVPNMENLVRINNEISSNFASGNAKDIEIDGVVYHNFKLLSMSGKVHKGEHIVTLVIA